ncbi:MAG TPA: ribbon-helix-helix protein, CopG family [Allocoleopsis sp.]
MNQLSSIQYMQSAQSARFHLRIDPNLRKKLEAQAKTERSSASAIVRSAVTQYINLNSHGQK